MFNNLGIGFSSYGKAISFISKHNLWVYFLYPVLISVVLIIGGTTAIAAWSGALGKWIMDIIGLGDNAHTEGWMGYLKGSLNFVLSWGIGLILFFIVLWLQKYIMLIVLSPVLALLSEKVDEIHTGNKYPFDFRQFVSDMFRGIGIALRNMIIELSIILLFLLVAWIPVVGLISAPFLYIVSCYFYGFSMIDYTSERRRLSIRESVTFIRRNKGFAIGNGLVYSLITFIPIIGIIIAPVLGAVAATLGTYEVLEKQKQTGRIA